MTSLRWQSCPHCGVFFTARSAANCPTCAKSLAPTPVSAPCGPARLPGESLSRRQVLSDGQVVPDAERCVQCGICSYNCPMGIDVRAHAWRGRPIHDSHCLTCSECVKRCPRGVLSFELIPLFTAK